MKTCLTLALALLLPLASHAHETWLVSTQRSIDTGTAIAFDMTSGERFPIAKSAIAPERIDSAECRQAAGDTPLKAGKKGANTLRLNAKLATSDSTTCWVQLKPKSIDLSVAKVDQYLTEIDAPEWARKTWAAMPEPRKWTEVYTKNAKVIVPRRGGGIADSAALTPAPVGLKLEFLSASDLSTGKLKGPLDVTVLLDGKPLAGLAVALWSEAKGNPVWQTSDAQGRVSFTVPAVGRWMVSGTDLRAVDASTGRWESQFSTLVFEILQ